MKLNKILALGLVAASIVTVSACGEKKVEVKSETDFKQKAAYAIGTLEGEQMLAIREQSKQYVGELDSSFIAQGFNDALANKSQLNKEEREEILKDFQTKYQDEAAKQFKAEADKNLKAGEDFLAKNKEQKGVKTTASGLQYKIVKMGKGPKPKEGDIVTVKYKGTLIDGKVFDETKGEAIDLALKDVIPGWIEGVKLMNKGSKFVLYVPANLAYGENQRTADIGPNSALIFDIELVNFKSPKK